MQRIKGRLSRSEGLRLLDLKMITALRKISKLIQPSVVVMSKTKLRKTT